MVEDRAVVAERVRSTCGGKSADHGFGSAESRETHISPNAEMMPKQSLALRCQFHDQPKKCVYETFLLLYNPEKENRG